MAYPLHWSPRSSLLKKNLSAKKVIDFNNILFRESARLLNTDFEATLASSGRTSEPLSNMYGVIEKAYSDHFQRFSGKSTTEGYVRLQFIENEETKNKGEFRELAIAELIVQIEATQANGVRPGDIAILVRGKKEGSMIARALVSQTIAAIHIAARMVCQIEAEKI